MKRLLAAALFAALALASIGPASAQQQAAAPVTYEAFCSYIVATGLPSSCVPTVGDTPFSAPALASATAAQIVAGVAGASIRVTYVAYSAYNSATAGLLELLYGTGTNCGTGTTVLHVLADVPATTQISGALGTGYGQIFIVPAGKSLCAEITAGTVTEASVAGTVAIY
jgi:opacity protein-like surface antigen